MGVAMTMLATLFGGFLARLSKDIVQKGVTVALFVGAVAVLYSTVFMPMLDTVMSTIRANIAVPEFIANSPLIPSALPYCLSVVFVVLFAEAALGFGRWVITTKFKILG
jgi:hypothetical protein